MKAPHNSTTHTPPTHVHKFMTIVATHLWWLEAINEHIRPVACRTSTTPNRRHSKSASPARPWWQAEGGARRLH
jgi:hypothetical protein